MEQYSVGRVLSRAFGLMRDTLGSVGLFVLIVVIAQSLVSYAMQALLLGGAGTTDLEDGSAALSALGRGLGSAGSTALLAVMLLGFGLSYSGAIHGLARYAESGDSSLADCFRIGLSRMFPAAALTVLWWLAVWLGLVVLIVPGLVLMAMWALALPALVVERRSILASFGRSRALTRGNRLSILGILVLTVLIYYAVTLAAAAIGLGTSLTNWRTLNQATLLATALAVPAGWFTSLLIKSMITSIYLESVLVKEGLRTDNLSRVFD